MLTDSRAKRVDSKSKVGGASGLFPSTEDMIIVCVSEVKDELVRPEWGEKIRNT